MTTSANHVDGDLYDTIASADFYPLDSADLTADTQASAWSDSLLGDPADADEPQPSRSGAVPVALAVAGALLAFGVLGAAVWDHLGQNRGDTVTIVPNAVTNQNTPAAVEPAPSITPVLTVIPATSLPASPAPAAAPVPQPVVAPAPVPVRQSVVTVPPADIPAPPPEDAPPPPAPPAPVVIVNVPLPQLPMSAPPPPPPLPKISLPAPSLPPLCLPPKHLDNGHCA